MEDVKNASGETTDVVSDQQEEQQAREDVVKYETHKKLLGQMKKTKELNDSLAAELEQLRLEKQQEEEAKLKETGEHEKIIKLREQKIEELQNQLNQTAEEKNQVLARQDTFDKLQAFYEKLPGKIKRKEYLNHVPLEEIARDPETGEIDSQSVDLAVNKFVKDHSDLIDTKSFARLPGDAAKGGNAPAFRELTLKEMRAQYADRVKERIGKGA